MPLELVSLIPSTDNQRINWDRLARSTDINRGVPLYGLRRPTDLGVGADSLRLALTEQIIEPGGEGVVRLYSARSPVGIPGVADEGQISAEWLWMKQNSPPDISEGIEVLLAFFPDLVVEDSSAGMDFDRATLDHVTNPWDWANFADGPIIMDFTVNFEQAYSAWTDTQAILGNVNTGINGASGVWFSSTSPGSLFISLGGTTIGVGRTNWTPYAPADDQQPHTYSLRSNAAGTSWELFIDGTPHPDNPQGISAPSFTAGSVTVGKHVINTDRYLDAAQLRNISVRTDKGLDWKYALDQTSGSSVTDESNNGNTGTVVTNRADPDEVWSLNQGIGKTGYIIIAASCEASQGGTIT